MIDFGKPYRSDDNRRLAALANYLRLTKALGPEHLVLVDPSAADLDSKWMKFFGSHLGYQLKLCEGQVIRSYCEIFAANCLNRFQDSVVSVAAFGLGSFYHSPPSPDSAGLEEAHECQATLDQINLVRTLGNLFNTVPVLSDPDFVSGDIRILEQLNLAVTPYDKSSEVPLQIDFEELSDRIILCFFYLPTGEKFVEGIISTLCDLSKKGKEILIISDDIRDWPLENEDQRFSAFEEAQYFEENQLFMYEFHN